MKLSSSFLFFLVLISCNTKPKQKSLSDSTVVFLMVDITDPDVTLPSAESIQDIFDLKSNTSRGAIYELLTISDVRYARATRFEIPPQPLLLQNPGDRKKYINEFLSDISSSLEELKTEPAGRPKSDVFAPIVQALNELSGLPISNAHKRLIVFSDLGENTDVFSVYRESDRILLSQNPDAVSKLLTSSVPLSDLHGISVDLIFSAPDFASSKMFAEMSAVIKKIIGAKGGSVKISGGYTN